MIQLIGPRHIRIFVLEDYVADEARIQVRRWNLDLELRLLEVCQAVSDPLFFLFDAISFDTS